MNDQFYDKVNKMFEEKLKYEEIPTIKVRDLKESKILENIDYENRLRFDSNLNMYKLQDDGFWVKVNNPNFKPEIVYKEKYIKNRSTKLT